MTILDRYPTAEKPERFDRGTFENDEIKLFPPLEAESKELVGYLRTGGCTVGCGACCESFVVPIDVERWGNTDFSPINHDWEPCRIVLPIDPEARGHVDGDDWEYWLKLHEVYMYQMPSGLLVVDVPIQPTSEPPSTQDFDAWTVWLEKHGIALLRRLGQQLLAHVPIPCTKLTEDGLCSVFGTPERPKMCAPYPEHPLDVEGIDFCTYKFQPITRDQMIPLTKVAKSPQPQTKSKRKKRKSKKGSKKR